MDRGRQPTKDWLNCLPDGKITNQFPYGKEKKEFVNFTSLRELP